MMRMGLFLFIVLRLRMIQVELLSWMRCYPWKRGHRFKFRVIKETKILGEFLLGAIVVFADV